MIKRNKYGAFLAVLDEAPRPVVERLIDDFKKGENNHGEESHELQKDR